MTPTPKGEELPIKTTKMKQKPNIKSYLLIATAVIIALGVLVTAVEFETDTQLNKTMETQIETRDCTRGHTPSGELAFIICEENMSVSFLRTEDNCSIYELNNISILRSCD